MADYYVTSAARGGSDAAAGTLLAPWETVAKVNGSSFSGNDKVHFDRGVGWREQLKPPSSGSAGSPITFRDYGVGSEPEFIASVAKSDAGDWTFEAGTDWYATVSVAPNIVWRNNVVLTKVATKAEVTDATKWFWDLGNTRVYTYGVSNPTTGGVLYEVGQRDDGIENGGGGRNYIILDGLATRYSNKWGITFFGTSTNTTVVRCNVQYNYLTGIYLTNAVNGHVSYSTVAYCGKSSTHPNSADHAGIAMVLGHPGTANAYCGHNIVSHVGRMAITIFGSGMDNTVVEYNDVSYTAENEFDTQNDNNQLGYGIQIYSTDGVNALDGVVVRYNSCHDTAMAGIAIINLVTNCTVHHNVCARNYNTGGVYATDYSANIVVYNATSGVKIYHNVCFQPVIASFGGAMHNLRMPAGGTLSSGEIRNNIFFNGYELNTSARTVFLASGSSPVPTMDTNLHYTPTLGDSSFILQWEGTQYSWAGRPGAADPNGVNADPLFVSAAAGDFHLKVASPCVNAGVVIAGINDDYRYSAPDIGAFEFLLDEGETPMFHRSNGNLQLRAATGVRMVLDSLADAMAAATDAEEVATFGSVRQSLAAAVGTVPQLHQPSVTAAGLAAQAWVEQLASAARTTTTNGPDQVNVSARGVLVVLDLTAFVTAASLTLKVQRKNADATYSDVAAAAALTAVNRVVILVDPLAGAEPTGVGDSVSLHLPHEWRVRVEHGNGNSHTYSVTAYPIR